MGVKTSLLVYANSDPQLTVRSRPPLDDHAALRLAATLFPTATWTGRMGNLAEDCYIRGDDVFIGCFGDVRIIAAGEFALDRPSELSETFVQAGSGGSVWLHAMHSVVDWVAFAIWEDGSLVRALSVDPRRGFVEDHGAPLDFEVPFLEGHHPVELDAGEAAYPLAFHPLELGEAALQSFFGFGLEGDISQNRFDPETVPLFALTQAPQRSRGTDDRGNRYDDPSPQRIRKAVHGLRRPGSYLILERPAGPEHYMQTRRDDGGTFLVEHRDGDASRHFGISGVDASTVGDLFGSYAAGDDRWRSMVDWERVSFG
jgi:hypothetical protein